MNVFLKKRAAFDIGSGATKMQISDCVVSEDKTRIVCTYFGQERPVAFGADWVKSNDGNLSDDIQLKGLATLLELKAEAEAVGVTEFSAIATEVFRKAKNGIEFLDKVRQQGINVNILTQDIEAKLGYSTVTASIEDNCGSVCVWDSGGASFQITTYLEYPLHLRTFMGALGTSVTTGILMRDIRKTDMSRKYDINPVSSEELNSLMEALSAKLCDRASQYDWLENAPVVYGVTGPNSIFKLCSSVLSLSKENGIQDTHESCELSTRRFRFSIDDAWRSLRTCINKTDIELNIFVDFVHSDGPSVIVPKLALLVTVMQHCKINIVECVECIGICPGLLTENCFWSISS
jgi:hypothetical protein